MHDKRPVNLDLATIRFPITAIVSILHRISGVVLILALPLLLCGLQWSLRSADDFQQLSLCLAAPLMRLVLWLILAASAYHFVAGIRHLLMDMGFAEEAASGRLSARIMLVVFVFIVLGLGAWLW